MNKLEKTWWIGLVVAIVALVVFWILGITGNLEAASYSFVLAGVSAWIALGAAGLNKLRHRNGF